jgi:glucokinase
MLDKVFLAADIGGTQTRVVVSDAAGRFRIRLARPTEAHKGKASVTDRLVALINEALQGIESSQVAGIGVGIAGAVNYESGTILQIPGLQEWANTPYRDVLAEKLGFPVGLDNDANLAALGEYRFGAARGYHHAVYLTISTGVGSGIISDGKLLRGANGTAGELGHITVDPNGGRCGCGNTGCLALFCSGSAIRRKAIVELEKGRDSLLAATVNHDFAKLTAPLIAEAARQGDSLALEIWQRAGQYLGMGIVNILNIFNPEIIVLGGGVVGAGDLLLDPMNKWIEQNAPLAVRSNTKIEIAALGDDAGLYGALALLT